jgi:ATP-dependent DNA helicase RecG
MIAEGRPSIRIRRALHDYPEIQFDIEEKFGGVMVTFAQKISQADSGTPQLTPQTAPQVTPQVEQLLAVIQGK